MVYPMDEHHMMYRHQNIQPNFNSQHGGFTPVSSMGHHVSAAGHYGFQPPSCDTPMFGVHNKENASCVPGWPAWSGPSGLGGAVTPLGNRKRAPDEVESHEFKRRRLTGGLSPSVGPGGTVQGPMQTQYHAQTPLGGAGVGAMPSHVQQQQQQGTSVQELRSAVQASSRYDMMYSSSMLCMDATIAELHGC